MADEKDAPRIINNEQKNRWEAHLGNAVALSDYRRGDGRITFTHTEVPPELEGKGIAGKLVKAALESAKSEGLRVIPRCSFVKGYIARHPEYQSLLAEE